MQEITIPRTLVNQILSHALLNPDEEVCGIVSSKNGHPVNTFRIRNVAPDRRKLFDMSPEELVDSFRNIRQQGEEIFAIYHSHPNSAAQPSALDIAQLEYHDVLYLIISLGEKGVLQLNGFKSIPHKNDKEMQPIELKVID